MEKTTIPAELRLMICFWTLQKTLKQPGDKVSNFKYNSAFAKRLHDLVDKGYVVQYVWR